MGLFRSHHTETRANKISSFTVNTAEYGSVVPEIIGTTRVGGNVIYYDDFKAHEHRDEQRSGKGGHSTHTNITYTYTVACILGLCEGPITGLGRVWVDKKVYQYPSSEIGLTLMSGTANQAPWSYVSANHPDKALSYAGLAYMYGVVDLGDSASLPQYNFEVLGKLLNTGDGVDVNPADYIRYILDKIGLSGVTIEGLDNYRSYCAASNMLISAPPDGEAKSAREIINAIRELTNSYMFWSNNRFKIVPCEVRNVGGWTADVSVKYALTADDFIPQSGGALVTYSRKDSSEVYNSFPVEFCNRANSYETETVSYKITSDIANYGLRQASATQAHYIYTKERAVKVAEMLARKAQYERNQYTFKLDWAFCRLEPGDLVTLTDENSGLDGTIVRIQTVTEETDGLLSFTAVGVPDDVNYSLPQFDVHAVDRPYVDYNIAAPNTMPVIFQPPADLTVDGLELWIAAKGAADGWGGCYVHVSDDDTNYRIAGQITSSARLGELVSSMTANATSCTVSCNGTLLSGTDQDAERGNTLCWIGGECVSYTTATLNNAGNYVLSGLKRGQYNTTPVVHPAGQNFVRLDASVLKLPFSKADVGKTIYLKFTSYNIFGGGEQDLADVTAYEYVLQQYYVPPVSGLTAYNRYRQLADGVNRYDIVVGWTPPDLQSYLEGRVWYKTNAGQAKYLTFEQGAKASELGFAGDWIFGGSGKDTVTIPQAIVGDTYRIAVTTVDIWGVETSPDASPQVDILVALKTEVPNTPDGLGIAFGESAVASWNEVTNTDVAFYEVRLDQQAGAESANLLARVTGLTATLPLTNRTGTIYLFAYSASGHYSYPAVLEYSKAVPPTPTAPTLTAKLGGFSLVAGAIPSGCNGMNIYIDGVTLVSVHTVNNVYTYTCDAGIYDVQVAYTDIFGEGAKSAVSRITVKATVDSSLLESQAVTKAKLETSIQNAVDDAVQSAQDIVGIKSDITSINGDITDINGDITTINGNISTINGNISTISTDLDSVESKADGIITELGKAPAQSGYRSISDLKTDVDNVSITVASNKNTQDGINSTVGSRLTVTENGISAITTNLNKAAGNTGYAAITQLNTSVSGLQSQVEEIYEMTDEGIAPDIATMKSQITQNSNAINTMVTTLNSSPSANTQYSSISTLSQTADSISSRVTTTEGQLAGTASSALQTSITQNANSITSLATRVTTTENQLGGTTTSGLKTAIQQNATDITSVATRVTATESQLAGTTTSALQTAIQQNASGITSVASRVTTTESQLDGTATSTLLTRINQNASGISAVVADVSDVSDGVDTIEENLNDSTKARSYTAIQVMQDGIASKCTLGEATSYFQQDHTGFYIKGSLIQIDGDTIIGNNVITRNAIASNAINASKIAAGAVTAAKMSVDSLSAITATIGTLRTADSGARTEIKDNLIEVYDENGTLRVRMGVW